MYAEQNPDTVKSTYFYNNNKQNVSAQGRSGQVGVSVYTDQTHSSQDDSIERRSAGGTGHLGARILVQPEPQARHSDVRYSPEKRRLPSESINSTTIRLHNATAADKGGHEAPSVYARQVAGSQIQPSNEIPLVHKRVASLHSKTTG